MIYQLYVNQQKNVWVSALALCMFLLSGCFSQKPAPVSLRGEEFYGDEENSEKSEYRLIRDRADGAPSTKSIRSHDQTQMEMLDETSILRAGSESAKCGFTLPLSGKVISAKNPNSSSGIFCGDGIAIVRRESAQVTASHDGRVLYIGKGLKVYGDLVILEHDKYTITMYYNVGGIKVKIGDEVKKGDVLATTSSARATQSSGSSHFCCFSMRYNGKAIDAAHHIRECDDTQK
ncbi:murein hydrolase activator EnvC family protein [Candidatus Anaplasma sp. TIGMIC]|uniref:murein hydrolase activator EnvC family protein n=1 Tax=Candidatus Anaplasma sp. TIGMIC TaxID=3020713 RepID=UPI002330A9E3|nr:M23 family metallopeptidase [Candidatus Anaplasma sp. TIGMIC]MDB1135799.1 M23 family metallopeptidase [Candidatus Anaplasma sp. TIGMIC]